MAPRFARAQLPAADSDPALRSHSGTLAQAAAQPRPPFTPVGLRAAVLRCRRLDQVTTSIEIKASRAIRSFGDVRVDRAKDAVDVPVVLEADLHVVAPVLVLDEFGLESSKALEHGSCPLKARWPDGQCLQVAHVQPPD